MYSPAGAARWAAQPARQTCPSDSTTQSAVLRADHYALGSRRPVSAVPPGRRSVRHHSRVPLFVVEPGRIGPVPHSKANWLSESSVGWRGLSGHFLALVLHGLTPAGGEVDR